VEQHGGRGLEAPAVDGAADPHVVAARSAVVGRLLDDGVFLADELDDVADDEGRASLFVLEGVLRGPHLAPELGRLEAHALLQLVQAVELPFQGMQLLVQVRIVVADLAVDEPVHGLDRGDRRRVEVEEVRWARKRSVQRRRYGGVRGHGCIRSSMERARSVQQRRRDGSGGGHGCNRAAFVSRWTRRGRTQRDL
jgi:hypothetical protein